MGKVAGLPYLKVQPVLQRLRRKPQLGYLFRKISREA